MMPIPVIGAAFELGTKLIERIFPDKAKADEAKLELLKMQQSGELQQTQVQLSAIISEANSGDKWTSRARPAFMYVMYFMILASIPMGVLFALNPETAEKIVSGMRQWLAAIPEEMWWLFGTGYLGYTGARTIDKIKGVASK